MMVFWLRSRQTYLGLSKEVYGSLLRYVSCMHLELNLRPQRVAIVPPQLVKAGEYCSARSLLIKIQHESGSSSFLPIS